MGRAQAGDRRAFSALVGRYRPLVLAVAFRESGDPELAEDAAQEALAIAWEKLRELRDPARFRAWLCGIVRNVLRYRARHGRRHAPDAVTPAQLAEVAAAVPSPLEHLIERQRCGAIESELAGLAERYRVPLLLYYGEQLSVREVATVLGLREETVRQRLARGRRKLRERVPREQLAAVPLFAGGPEAHGGMGAASGQGLARTLAAAGGGGKGAAVLFGVAAVVALVALVDRAPANRPSGSTSSEPARVTSVAPAGAAALVAAEPELAPEAAPRIAGRSGATVEMGEPEVRRARSGGVAVTFFAGRSLVSMTARKPKPLLLALSLSAALALTLDAGVASAEEGPPAEKVKKKEKAPPKKAPRKVKHYDFEGDNVRGDGILPSGDNVFVPRPIKHGSLIRLRASFLPEIVRAASEVR